MFQNLDLLAKLTKKRKAPTKQPPKAKRPKVEEKVTTRIPKHTWNTINIWVNHAWKLDRASIQGGKVKFWNDKYNKHKPIQIKFNNEQNETVVMNLDGEKYTEHTQDDDVPSSSHEEDEEWEEEEEEDDGEEVKNVYVSASGSSDSDSDELSKYNKPIVTDLDKVYKEQKEKMGKQSDASDDDDEEEIEPYDKEEYVSAMKVLASYSTVATVKKKITKTQMGHAGVQKKEKEFLMLNASTFAPYIKQQADKLIDSKPLKRLKLYTCNRKQFEFPDPKPWQLEAAADQSQVNMIQQNLPHGGKVHTFYPKDIMMNMETQMWAATGACSHLDHFAHGAEVALRDGLADAKKLVVSGDQQNGLDSVIKKISDAQKMIKIAGINNIQVAQTCITAGCNYQLLRRDSLLQFHHENLDEKDIRQLRAQPFGQKDLFGTILASKAKEVTTQTRHRANRIIINNSTKEEKKKTYQQPAAKATTSANTDYQPRGGGQQQQKRGRGIFLNAFGKDPKKLQQPKTGNQPFRRGGRGYRGGYRPRRQAPRGNQY